MKKIQFIFFYSLFVFYSCNSLKNNQLKLKKQVNICIQEETKRYTIQEEQLDIYKSYENINLLLINNGFLKEKTKQGYLILLSEVINSNKNYNLLFNELIKNERNIDNLLGPGIFQAPFKCLGKTIVLNNLHEDNYYSKYFSTLTKTFENLTPENTETFLDLVRDTPEKEINDIVFQAPILAIFIGYLDKKLSNKTLN